MTTPTTAGEWLAEAIEEAEKLEKFRHGFPVGPLATPVDTTAVRAYLAALKAIAHLHRPDGHGDCWTCAGSIYSQYEYPCPTLRTVAEVFRGREGWTRWFA